MAPAQHKGAADVTSDHESEVQSMAESTSSDSSDTKSCADSDANLMSAAEASNVNNTDSAPLQPVHSSAVVANPFTLAKRSKGMPSDIAETSRPHRALKEKLHKARIAKQSKGRKRGTKAEEKANRRSSYVNWKAPHLWRQINIAVKQVGYPWRQTDIVKRLRQMDPGVYGKLAEQTLGAWIDRAYQSRYGCFKWKDKVALQAGDGFAPGGGNTRHGILVRTSLPADFHGTYKFHRHSFLTSLTASRRSCEICVSPRSPSRPSPLAPSSLPSSISMPQSCLNAKLHPIANSSAPILSSIDSFEIRWVGQSERQHGQLKKFRTTGRSNVARCSFASLALFATRRFPPS